MGQFEHFQFFPNQRRKIELLGWAELMNAQSEKRIRFDLQMQLTGQNMLGMPDFIGRGFEVMGREGSHDKKIDIDIELEGVHFEAFSTEDCKEAIRVDTLGLELADEVKQLGLTYVKFSSATIRNFKLVRVGADVALQFNITVKSSAGLVLWAHHYHGATFWAMFSEAQLVVPKKEEDPDQMKLGEQPPAKEKAKGDPCGFADGNGGACILDAYHEGEHTFSNAKPVELNSRQKKVARELAKAGVN
jgi:hypothetical protein